MESAARGDEAPPLPGKRGRFLLYLGPPVIKPIDGRGRYVHVSWKSRPDGTFAYAIRDFIAGLERRESDDMPIELIWRRALDRIPAKGDLFRPHTDARFWLETLTALTNRFQEHHNQAERSRLGD